MAAARKTPGVHIVESTIFPNSVVEVPTAVPAFIGYTEKADHQGTSLSNVPWRITSLAQFVEHFGGPPLGRFTLVDAAPPVLHATPPALFESDFSLRLPNCPSGEKKEYWLRQDSGVFLLYYSMQLFFQNGGAACYIVSVGHYDECLDADKLLNGIAALSKEAEPTLLVVPDAVLLEGTQGHRSSACIAVQQAVIKHCGEEMKNRFAILDIHDGFRARSDPAGDCIAQFRDALGTQTLDFAAAYYPWLDTTIVAEKDLSYLNIKNPEVLQTLLIADMMLDPALAPADPISKKQFDDKTRAVGAITRTWAIDKDTLKTDDDITRAKLAINQLLHQFSPLYAIVMAAIAKKLNRLPPGAAMAGLYTSVDHARGVWKAPANVSLNAVIAPAVDISHEAQEDMNGTTTGKSINAIRAFAGAGVLVWGARTLDGNSVDWRYINVRRTMIMLEESLRLAMAAYAFEANVANTWVTVKGMANNFLTGIWKRGGLAGASPGEAFSVFVGLGETMTVNDILDGIMRVTVLVALSGPAEFIEITFQQQMQQA